MNTLASIICKDNYAVHVRRIMPSRRGRTGLYICCIRLVLSIDPGILPPPPDERVELTAILLCLIIKFTKTRWNLPHGQETQTRPQGSGASSTGHRRIVSDQRVFRCPRSRPGQVRDAAPCRERRTAGKPGGGRLRILTALL